MPPALPPPGFPKPGRPHSIVDGVSKLPSTTTVTITTASATTINVALPVGPASGGKQECPSAAEMDQLAQAYIKALLAQPGVVSVTLIAIRCTWLVSARAPALRRARPQRAGSGALPRARPARRPARARREL
jgi:hypothetical protein